MVLKNFSYSILRSANLQGIERLLLIAERYITTVEELHVSPRTILPQGSSFQGTPVSLYVVSESPKMDFVIKVTFLCKILMVFSLFF